MNGHFINMFTNCIVRYTLQDFLKSVIYILFWSVMTLQTSKTTNNLARLFWRIWHALFLLKVNCNSSFSQVNSVINGEGITHTTEKFWTEAPKESLKTTEKFTVESTSRSDAPFTTIPPMKVTSSKEVEAKSSPLSGIKSTTAPSLKSAEAEG